MDGYKDVLSDKFPTGLPPRRGVDHKIEFLLGSTPKAKAPYRMTMAKRQLLMDTLRELEDQGFIRPSKTAYGALIMFVAKKGGWRVCIDYHVLNK